MLAGNKPAWGQPPANDRSRRLASIQPVGGRRRGRGGGPGPLSWNSAKGSSIYLEAKKRLIATHPNSKFPLTHSKHRTRQFLIATRIPFSIPYSSLSLFTLTPPRREGRGFNRALAPAVFRSSQQDVCETRPSRILTNALRPEQRTRRRAFTPPAARRMLARGSSSIIPGKEPIQANCGGSPCGFS